jgi:hypothetical protein
MNCRSWHARHSNVRRSMPRAFIGSISLIAVSPPHAGHRPSTPMGVELGACTLYPFAVNALRLLGKYKCGSDANGGRLDRALSLGLLTNRVCTILITSPA